MKKIYVAGHRGLVGSALVRRIEEDGDFEWIGASHLDLDLTDGPKVYEFLKAHKPDVVIIAAAKVGGIKANNDFPVQFLTTNLQIQVSLLEACRRLAISSVIFLGSSCIYPKFALQPIEESSLLTGPLEETNEAYAIAKISGVKMVDYVRQQYGLDWFSLMPTNLYGPGDNFNLESSHVLPAMIRKFHEAKVANAEQVTLWGDGSPLREFLHSDDLATAVIHLIHNRSEWGLLNVGSGLEISIKDLASLVASIVGFNGGISWNTAFPNGTPRKLLDSTRIKSTGWSPKIDLPTGILQTYEKYLNKTHD